MTEHDPRRAAQRFAVPPGLEQYPLTVIWWVFFAPLVYGTVIIYAVSLVSPSTIEGLTAEGGGVAQSRALMLAVVLIQVAVFWRMTGWSLRKGLGPAAGSLAITPVWAVLALALGAAELLVGPMFIEAVFRPEGENWFWRDPAQAEDFAATALSGAAMASLLILAPVLEEIAFRGMALGHLIARGMPPGMALVLTSAAFAISHYQYTALGMAAIFLAGLLYGWLRVASGSVGVAILAHAASNGLAIALVAASPAAT
jgi:membrane protease YdiL (CAAX protease family)